MSGGTSAPQVRNTEMVDILSTDFVKRNEATLAWGKAISMFQMLPALRGFWPMSSYDATLIYDLSGQGRNLTRSAVTHQWIGLVPTGRFAVATTRYLYRADEAGLDITGTEAYMSAGYPGLTLGGWFQPDAMGADAGLIGKQAGAGNRSYVLWKPAADTPAMTVSTDGTAVVTATSTVTQAASTWYFVVGRFTPSTEVAVFVNGTKTTNVVGVPASIFASNAEFDVGRYNAGNYFEGYGSLFFLCAAALSDRFIQALYHHTRSLFGIV